MDEGNAPGLFEGDRLVPSRIFGQRPQAAPSAPPAQAQPAAPLMGNFADVVSDAPQVIQAAAQQPDRYANFQKPSSADRYANFQKPSSEDHYASFEKKPASSYATMARKPESDYITMTPQESNLDLLLATAGAHTAGGVVRNDPANAGASAMAGATAAAKAPGRLGRLRSKLFGGMF